MVCGWGHQIWDFKYKISKHYAASSGETHFVDHDMPMEVNLFKLSWIQNSGSSDYNGKSVRWRQTILRYDDFSNYVSRCYASCLSRYLAFVPKNLCVCFQVYISVQCGMPGYSFIHTVLKIKLSHVDCQEMLWAQRESFAHSSQRSSQG